MDSSMYIEAFEDATGIKIKDRNGFMTAMRGIVRSCKEGNEDDGEDEDEDEDQGKGKGLPSVALILGKKGK